MPDVTETQATREKLGDYLGQVAINFGLLTEENRERALEIQARFAALVELGKIDNATTLTAVSDDAQWVPLATERGVQIPRLNEIRAAVHTGQGVPAGVPATGDIAAAMGFIAAEDKNALLSAQAAERSLKAIEGARTIETTAAPAPEARLLEVVQAKKWKNIGNDKDPAYLKTAQEANFKAETMAALLAVAPEAASSPIVQKGLEALEDLSTISYHNAANVLLGAPNQPANDPRTQAANALRGVVDNQLASPEKTMRHMRDVDGALSSLTVYLGQHNKISASALLAVTGALHDKSISAMMRTNSSVLGTP